MHFTISILLLLITHQALGSQNTINYCGSRMCDFSDSHTFCQYSEGPSRSCQGYIDAHLSLDEKVRIIARLNRRRFEAANGRLDNLPTAGNMLKLRWVEELAREAQLWADQCRPYSIPEEHDKCRDLYSVTVGQCVASVVGDAPGLRPETLADTWYMQSKLFKANVTNYQLPISNAPAHSYKDFAQIIWAKTYMVGCARSHFTSTWRGRMVSVERLVCNFAPKGPVPGRELWIVAEPSSVCPPRSKPDQIFGLCSYQNNSEETYDILYDKNINLTQERALLDSVMELDNNQSMDYYGSLDIKYLSKMSALTIASPEMTTSIEYNTNEIISKTDSINDLTAIDSAIQKYIYNMIHNNKSSTTRKAKALKKHRRRMISQNVRRIKPYDSDFINDDIDDGMNENDDNVEETEYEEYSEMEDEITTKTEIETNQDNERFNDRTASKIVRQENLPKNHATITNLDESVIERIVQEYDYLSDPETVRELKVLLQSMESNEAELDNPSLRHGKVRRESGNFDDEADNSRGRYIPMPQLNSDTYNDHTPPKSSPSALNSVLKHIPYVKPFQDKWLGGSSHVLHYDSLLLMFLLLILSFCR